MKALGTKTLNTEKLILRPFKLSDAPAMFDNWAGHPSNVTYLTWPAHESLEVTEKVIQEWVNNYQHPWYYNWAIAVKDEPDTVIGSISMVKFSHDINACEIGYVLSKKFWGQGYMTQALKEVIRFLFEEADVNRIFATYDSRNKASGKVMEKAGMFYEGTHRQGNLNNLGLVDSVVYAILKEDYTNHTHSLADLVDFKKSIHDPNVNLEVLNN